MAARVLKSSDCLANDNFQSSVIARCRQKSVRLLQSFFAPLVANCQINMCPIRPLRDVRFERCLDLTSFEQARASLKRSYRVAICQSVLDPTDEVLARIACASSASARSKAISDGRERSTLNASARAARRTGAGCGEISFRRSRIAEARSMSSTTARS